MNIIHERSVDWTGAPEPNTGIAFAPIHRQFRKQHDPGELRLHCASDVLRRPFKITGLMKFLGGFLLLTALITSVQATGSVTLAWNRSSNTNVAGYNIYYGGASGTYTNEISAGNATNATVSGLVQGTTYYFAVTTCAASGMESPFSSEISYTVPSSNNLPTITLTAPSNGAGYTAPATINLAASVTTNGHSITKVQFYNGATLLGEDTSAPYSFTWSNVSSGSYTLTARVVYDAGSTVASSLANVTVANPAPTVALTAPSNGAGYTAPATINLAASVTTNGHSITKVQFYNGATLLGEDTSAPYSFTWNNVGSGNYSLTAGVVYDSGSTVASSSVDIAIASVTVVVTLWPSTAVPGVVDGGPDSAVELGVKFRSDVAGSITGIRFYKASANTGTHVGNLWTSTGTLLATATFTGETASGWQQVNFATPVSITTNTVYVASYHANNGHYSANGNYFSVNGVDNPPLHALTNGVSGGNGVFAYGSSSAFPNQTWNARNYWVDVVWQGELPGVQLLVTHTRQFVLSVTGTIGHTYDIQATQDFKTWTVIGTVTVGTNGLSVFTDTNAASFSKRFYRTRG
jgi:sulfur relay (sulfurtransferase) complex TusBCD TusD component (DsrE family)